jgi:deoxyribonuclease-4
MVGSHCSGAGGLHRAIEEALALGLDCVQVFTRNQRQWRAPPLSDEAISLWRAAMRDAGWDDLPGRSTSHNSYLCNLASPDDAIRAKSIALQRDELERCEALGIRFCVMHPGAHLGVRGERGAEPTADEAAGLARIAKGLDEIHRALRGYAVITCLETTAGSGTNLGADFLHLARIRELVREPERVGYCLDTCHVAAAGYDVSTDASAAATLAEFDRICGLERLFVVHVNDSKTPPGSRLDRHEHIGHGTCGMAWFRAIMRHPALAKTPKILETPKEEDESGTPWDRVNARRLRSLLTRSRSTADKPTAPRRRREAP